MAMQEIIMEVKSITATNGAAVMMDFRLARDSVLYGLCPLEAIAAAEEMGGASPSAAARRGRRRIQDQTGIALRWLGATEYQDEQPYEYGDEMIECHEVRAVQTVKAVHKPGSEQGGRR
jgi:hypothetical protein